MNMLVEMMKPLGSGWQAEGPFGIWEHTKHKGWSIINVEPGYVVTYRNKVNSQEFTNLDEAVEAGDKVINTLYGE